MAVGQGDARVPGEAVEQLGQGVAIGLQLVGAEVGVGQRGQAEIAEETPAAFVLLVQVGEDQVEHGRVGQDGPADDRRRRRGAGFDPLLEKGDVVGRRPRLFAGRRHLAGGDALEERRLVGLSGHDLLAGDELGGVEDEVHAAFGRAVLAVAAVAVGVEDGQRLDGQRRRVRVGRPQRTAARRDPERATAATGRERLASSRSPTSQGDRSRAV